MVKSKTLAILDFAVVQMLIICLAFADIRLLSISSTVLAFGITALYCLVRNNVNKQVFYFTIFKILFIFWSLLSCIWSVNVSTSFDYCITLCLRLMLSLSILFYVDSKDRLIRLLKFVVLAAIVLSARIILAVPFSAYGETRIGQYLSFNEDSSYGNTGITYVLGVSSVLLICSKRSIINNGLFKYFWVTIFTLLSLLSGSKKQFLFLIIAAIVLVVSRSKDMVKLIKNCLIAIAIIVIISYITFNNELLYNSIGRRIESMLAFFFEDVGIADDSTINRALYIRFAWEAFLNNPLRGIGLDGFQYVNPITQCWAECNFVEIFADLGIIGFILYYFPHLMIVVSLIKRLKVKEEVDYILLSLLLVLIIIDATMVSYRSVSLQIWLALAFSMHTVQQRQKHREVECRNLYQVVRG